MSLLHYIDNEVPGFGEWDAVVQSGSSTIVQATDAAFPERGSLGLRTTIVGTSPAYVRKDNMNVSIAPGQTIYTAFMARFANKPSSYTKISQGYNVSGDTLYVLYTNSSGVFEWYIADDAGNFHGFTGSTDCSDNNWHWVVIGLHRASSSTGADGWGKLWVDGILEAQYTSVDNYDRLSDFDQFRLGVPSHARDGFVIDHDEIKITADTYPEPYVPTPSSDYLQAQRIVVLYRQGDADSRAFADYCVESLSIPRCNLCPLPNASGNETLTDYATFQAEVENDLSDWLDRNPTVKSNCMCFLIGYGVPGYFYHNGLKHSATSRLMNFGATFSSKSSNPLYNPDTVERLTKSTLGGKYLSVRIDADTLANAKAMIDRSLTVSALSALPATDILYSGDGDYRVSLDCQHLRIITEAIEETVNNDAFIFGTAPHYYGTAGERVAAIFDKEYSADSLRTTAADLSRAIITYNYAAGAGFSEAADMISPTPFFEMLRIDGTFAEAIAVAVAHLDYTAVAIGNPLMTVAFRKNGYNIYKGVGGVEHINWDNPVAYLRAEQQVITFRENLIPHQQYIYAVRAVSSSGIVEHNTNVITYVEIDEQGNLSPLPLAKPINLDVATTESGIFVAFS
ncbi:MAG: hypothetical protein J7L99_01290, partial [Planctomycetes bacterium]|nr:hypothetical protein [Planctomycetota bacterium]